MSAQTVHATSLSLCIGSVWRGVLIKGPSGIGKSDLALRCLEAGFCLISDDYSEIFISNQKLYATPPKTIQGRIEVRGLGIMAMPHRALSAIDLVVHCQKESPERLPEAEVTPIMGLYIPTLRLVPHEASTVAKLLNCLRTFR